MSLGDIVSRTNAILSKYEKYDVHKEEKKASLAADAFMDEYANIAIRIEELNAKSAQAAEEQNRALRAAVNAEVRRAKAHLLDVDLVKLEKLVRKGKSVPQEVLDDRLTKVNQTRSAIEGIADGIHNNRKPVRLAAGTSGSPSKGATISLDANASQLHSAEYHKQTEESSRFKQEFEISKLKQDRQLDNIERGLGTLKEIGQAMGETLQHHDVLITAINEKMDDVTNQLKTNNMKLKGIVTQMRSTRNFCIDIILLVVILAIGLYIYDVVK